MDIPASDHYVVVLWDYDSAPDAQDYYVWKKWVYCDAKVARQALRSHLEWKCGYLDLAFAVGAALFTKEGVHVEGYGMTFPMPPTKFPSAER